MTRQKKSGSAPKRRPRPKRTNVATHLPRAPRSLFTHCGASWAAVKADTGHFPSPFPPASQIEGNLGTLGTALQEAEGGDAAATASVVAADAKVREDFRQLKAYVQGVLQGLPPEEVAPVLASILMFESKVGTKKPKPPLGVQQGASGSVILDALAVPGALIYEWEQGLDQASFTPAGRTGQARLAVAGLTPGKQYWFRFSAFLRDGTTTDHVVAGPFMVK
jgi:hypothetical protein